MRRALDSTERSKVYESIASEWETITNNIASSIESSISSNREIKVGVNKIVYTLLDSYKKNLKNARILID